MKKLILITTTLVLGVALVIEVLNPHSFLGVQGAYVRVFLLLTLAAIWCFLSKKFPQNFGRAGFIMILIAASVYMFAALHIQRENALYENLEFRNKTN